MPRPLGPSLPPVYTHGGALRGLRHQRGRRHLDFAAGDVCRGTTNADRGHDVPTFTSLRFNLASTPHRDTLLDRKTIVRPDSPLARNVIGRMRLSQLDDLDLRRVRGQIL